MGRAAGAPDRLEAPQGRVDDRPDGVVVREGRDAADCEAGRLTYLVTLGLAHAVPEFGRVDPPVTGAEAEQRAIGVHEDERLDDLADADADGVRSFLCGSRRVRELADLDVQPEVMKMVLETLRGRVERHRLRVCQPCRSSRSKT